MPDRFESVRDIAMCVSAAASSRPDIARPLVIAIDGRSAAGKSTLAGELAALLNKEDAAVVAMDDFYRVIDSDRRDAMTPAEGVARYFDWQRLASEVLARVRVGHTLAYELYDWGENCLGDVRDLTPGSVVIVEGVYSARPELRPFVDYHVLVETSGKERRRRQLARAESAMTWIERWAAAEDLYFDTVYVADADYEVSGD